ncbi:MAG: Fic family protein [Gemmatimonadaceae bacterium]
MSRLQLEVELDRLVGIVGRFADGAAISEIQREFRPVLSRRTLQRRLETLVARGRLGVVGTRRWARYHVAHPAEQANAVGDAGEVSQTPEPASARWVVPDVAITVSIPLSAAAEEIKAAVRQPIIARKPIGYQTEFLNAYTPNVTSYLPQNLREQFHQVGRSPTGEAPAGTFAQHILDRLLIDLSWASSRLEGNTYSRLDTERLINAGQAAEGKDAVETQMILNHKAAIQYLVNNADEIAVKPRTIIELHALLSDGLMANPRACGALRTCAVGIGGSVYVPLVLPQQVEELFAIVLEMADEILDPFEQAFFLMVHLPYLQPFEDANKRVSRLAANIPLIKHNLVPLSFLDVPANAYIEGLLGVYELQRVELLRDVFTWGYERSCQQYATVQRQVAHPDLFRLRHRIALGQTIRTIVNERADTNASSIRRAMPESVGVAEQDRFVELVLKEFESLTEANAVRFGVHPFEFDAWRQRLAPRT